MNSSDEIKNTVKEQYGAIAKTRVSNASCCSPKHDLTTIMSDDYATVSGYEAEADLGLGCGVPTAFAHITEGMTVLDLGSGAGNDVFIAAKYVGASGTAIGVDMTEAMIARANGNKEKLGIANVEFRLGEIESLPIESESVDVVISNCVLNLVPDKRKAFSEIYRVLKPGGHFTISDIVLEGELPLQLQKIAEMWVGCVAGAMQKSDYLAVAGQTGFQDFVLEKDKAIALPEQYVQPILKAAGLTEEDLSFSIRSITLRAAKPSLPPTRIIRRAVEGDLEFIRALLAQNTLPDIELEKYIDTFLLIEEHGELLGCGGIEIHDSYGLVRSVAIDPRFHSKGLGTILYDALELDARMFFLKGIYLFTNTAKEFFTKAGFTETSRAEIPQPLHASGEYADVCCTHAHVMKKQLCSENETPVQFPILEIQPTSCCG